MFVISDVHDGFAAAQPPALMLPGVTPHKGLAPSGLSFIIINYIKGLLLNLPFKAHSLCISNGREIAKY